MSKVCVLLAEGFEELEAVTILDVLRRAEIETESLSVGNQRVAGAHGIPVLADRTLKEGAGERWDAVILPGGLPGATNLQEDAQVLALVQEQNQSGRTVAAICAAPIALASAGVLTGIRATAYLTEQDRLRQAGAFYTGLPVERERLIITATGPTASIQFGRAIADALTIR